MTITEYFAEPTRTASAIIMVAVLVGVALRRKRNIHPKIMLSCFAADVGLLLWVEFARGAIEQSASSMTPLLAVHIVLALLMLLMYVLLTRSGLKLLKLPEDEESPTEEVAKIRDKHVVGGGLFILLRISVMVTAVMVAN